VVLQVLCQGEREGGNGLGRGEGFVKVQKQGKWCSCAPVVTGEEQGAFGVC
jgi:hypothetical protein